MRNFPEGGGASLESMRARRTGDVPRKGRRGTQESTRAGRTGNAPTGIAAAALHRPGGLDGRTQEEVGISSLGSTRVRTGSMPTR